MNVDEPFSSPASADVQILGDNEYSAEIAGDSPKSFDMLGGGDSESGGWLSSLGDSFGGGDGGAPAQVTVPTGASIFPKEIIRTSRRWAEKRYTNIVHWNNLEKGGHFAAFEQPETFVDEVRTCFRNVR